MARERLTFFFDFVSPYSYLAWSRIREIARAHGMECDARPVLLAAILAATGARGPAEIDARRAWLWRDILRAAARTGIPLRGPAKHPFRPLSTLRLALAEVAGSDQERIITTLFDLGWRDGIDLGDDDAIARGLAAAGFDPVALFAASRSDAAKQLLRTQTDEAIGLGVFGVPTVQARGELFFGQDRLSDLELFLDGKLHVDESLYHSLVARPVGASRT